MGCGACAGKKSAAAVLPSIQPAVPSVDAGLVAELRAQWSPDEYQKLIREWSRIRATEGFARMAKEKPLEFREKVISGVPAELRWEVWKAALEISETGYSDYSLFLSKEIPSSVLHNIKKDIDRTFPNFDYFHSGGQSALANVLRALAAADPDVAYCQGLNCVLGLLLLVSNGDEAGCFSVYREASRRFKWRGLYLQEFPKMWEMTYQWKAVFRAMNRDLYKSLKAAGVQEALWLTKGLLTVYSALLPMSLAIRVWDVMLVEGEEVMFKTALTVMATIRTDVQGRELADIATLLRNLSQRAFQVNAFISAMRKTQIAAQLLEKGSAKYKKKQQQQQASNIVS